MTKTGLVYLRSIPVLYFRAQGPYSVSSVTAWKEMFDWLDAKGLRRTTGRGYGLSRDNPSVVGRDRCRYDACIELPSDVDPAVFDGVLQQRLPGGAYVRKRHVGAYNSLRHSIVEMRDHWAPNAGVSIDLRRPLVTIYLSDPATVAEEQLKADVCLPISASASDGRSAA